VASPASSASPEGPPRKGAVLVGRIADDAGIGVTATLPYVLGFGGVLLLSEVLWRLGLHCLNRLDARGIEQLYITGMDELFAKDSAFFHSNFAGSLTKRVLSFASRFEDFVDTMTFSVVGSLVPCCSGPWCCGTTNRCSWSSCWR
jgi:ATP-binding cassette subfamily B protein